MQVISKHHHDFQDYNTLASNIEWLVSTKGCMLIEVGGRIYLISEYHVPDNTSIFALEIVGHDVTKFLMSLPNTNDDTYSRLVMSTSTTEPVRRKFNSNMPYSIHIGR